MCGIAGCASLDARRPPVAEGVRRMLPCIAHRGPDDEGIHADTGIVLGHRRLSIIDVEGGHQPLSGTRDSTIVVCNGEVYNYRELRAQLEARGHRFRTVSDTEVAAHAYDAWDTAFLERLDGMFAIALWDGARRRLILARDRMGEKPLYWTVADGLLVFGSELSALLAHPSVEATLDSAALSAYLGLEYVPAPQTMLAGVHKLEPGTLVVLEDGEIETRRYWTLDAQPAARPRSYADAVEELHEKLDRAVRSRLVSDVPLGIFLSGGIDSSTVAALAARAGALETFSIGFDEPSFDESGWARDVARWIGSRHHEQKVRASDMPDLVPGLGALLDEPIGDASILPTAMLSRFARKRVTVALGGDGGDELFAGYYMHQGQRVAELARRLPGFAQRGLAAAVTKLPVSHANFSLGFRIRTYLRGSAHAPPLNHVLWMSSFAPAEQELLLQPDVYDAGGRGRETFRAAHAAWAASEGAPLLARVTHLDALTYLPNDILTKVDRASMAVALEVRAPFLARDVVEFAFGVPDAWRMRGLTGKRMLRDAARNLLPPGVLSRRKKGFGVPVAAWINGALATLVDDVLSADRLRTGGLFRPAAVQRLIAEHREGRADHRKKIWTLLVFELWRAHRLESRHEGVAAQGAARA
ncbi:MAG: asparagine synthase (glutamine-hydrolyzing) [Gemmatimonadetes bacterium]|nr:asparagine synthase (glutamine-hydrolyzing) [Gemmatimonadota bacterium]